MSNQKQQATAIINSLMQILMGRGERIAAQALAIAEQTQLNAVRATEISALSEQLTRADVQLAEARAAVLAAMENDRSDQEAIANATAQAMQLASENSDLRGQLAALSERTAEAVAAAEQAQEAVQRLEFSATVEDEALREVMAKAEEFLAAEQPRAEA